MCGGDAGYSSAKRNYPKVAVLTAKKVWALKRIKDNAIEPNFPVMKVKDVVQLTLLSVWFSFCLFDALQSCKVRLRNKR